MERTYRCKNCSADVYSGCLCGCCGYRHVPGERKAKTDTDRIAQLTAELHDAFEGLGEAQTQLDAERADHERTKAEMADARAQLDKVRRDRDEMIRVHDEVEAERDAAQAEVAAMRDVIERVNVTLFYGHGHVDGRVPDCSVCDDLAAMRAALAGTAGRDLAARVTLLEAVAEAARNLSYHYHFETMGRLRNALAALDKESK
jgi:chromosome segregation ATPase